MQEDAKRIDVFFYGLFMDEALLRGKGLNPLDRRVASVENFRLAVGARATSSNGSAVGRVSTDEEREGC